MKAEQIADAVGMSRSFPSVSRNAQAIRSTVISEKNGLRWPAVCNGKIRRFRQRWRMLSGIMMKNIL